MLHNLHRRVHPEYQLLQCTLADFAFSQIFFSTSTVLSPSQQFCFRNRFCILVAHFLKSIETFTFASTKQAVCKFPPSLWGEASRNCSLRTRGSDKFTKFTFSTHPRHISHYKETFSLTRWSMIYARNSHSISITTSSPSAISQKICQPQ